jgi:hypothetical protein
MKCPDLVNVRCRVKSSCGSGGTKIPISRTLARMGKNLPVVLTTVGKRGIEPLRLAARDPKSRLSANSSTSPVGEL